MEIWEISFLRGHWLIVIVLHIILKIKLKSYDFYGNLNNK
jgi:hypothetical protein